MITVIAFIVALAILIVVHEYGHYSVARACGVKVLRFSVGFGRVLWRRENRNGTEFTLSALPLGGYVKMLDERDGVVLPAERAQAFNNRPLRQRAAVVAAGPAANLVLAIFLFAAVAWIGQDEPVAVMGTPAAGSIAERAGLRAGDRVLAASNDGQQWQDLEALPALQARLGEALTLGQKLYISVSDNAGHGRRSLVLELDRLAGQTFDQRLQRSLGLQPFSDPVLAKINPGGAGAAAGLRVGDRVLSVDGRLVSDAGFLREAIRAAHDGRTGREMQWRIERAGQPLALTVQPRVVDDAGQPIGRLEVAIGSAPQLVRVSHDLVGSLALGAQRCWDLSRLTLQVLGRMLVGEASLKNLSGPLTIADVAGQTAKLGAVPYLDFLARISLGLAVLNLLPLPMLDGGHLMYYLFEGLSGRPVSEWWQRQLQRAGALILMLMMFLALSNDVVRLTGPH